MSENNQATPPPMKKLTLLMLKAKEAIRCAVNVGALAMGLVLSLICAGLIVSWAFSKEVSSLQVDKDLLPLTPSTTYDFSHSVVRLSRDGEFFCSGVVIGNNYVLTASHCLVDKDYRMQRGDIEVMSDDSAIKVIAKAVGVNTRVEFGLIQGDFSGIPGAYLESKNLVLNPILGACGYPQGAHAVHCEGLIPVINDAFFVKCKGSLFPGMSGGPVFDNRGYVVGINVLVYSAAQNGGAAYAPTIGALSTFKIGD